MTKGNEIEEDSINSPKIEGEMQSEKKSAVD